MSDPEKTIFISYRRSTSKYLALLMFKELNRRGYDVFYDIETIDSGAFDSIILNQIAARTHFIVLLAEGSLDRCGEPGDWLRQEIEHAMDLERNIVPVMVEQFIFGTVEQQLTGKLSYLPRYNGLKLYYEYFDAAVDNLCSRYLKRPEYPVIITRIPSVEENAVQRKIAEAISQPAPTKEELSAEQYFNRGYDKSRNQIDMDGAVADYTEAIGLNRQYIEAYNKRGDVRYALGDLDGAIADYAEASQISQQSKAYIDRGVSRAARGDLDGAIVDYTDAIRLNPQSAEGYINRGIMHYEKRDYACAIADWSDAIRLNPEIYEAYNNRAEAFFAQGQYKDAFSDFTSAKHLYPDSEFACAGLAITNHALGQISEAKQLWQFLVEQGSDYLDADWVQKELNWAEPLVEEARKLIARL